jgi:alcohol dehydrogenase (cytochrome c)
MRKIPFLALLCAATMFGQGGPLDPAELVKPLSANWTSYSGDLSGKRFSSLKQVNVNTVKNLSLRWLSTNIRSGCGPNGTSQSGAAGPSNPLVVSGLGDGSSNSCGPARLQGGIIVVNGIIYAASSFNVFAIEAATGQVLWQHYWKARPGHNLGTRGLAMWNNYIYFGEHDDWLVCLDARTGKEVWKKEIASLAENYWISNAPMVLGNHIVIGVSNNLDMPAFIKSLDPETGAQQWEHYMTAQNPGEEGVDSWVSLDEARHGGGTSWIPGSYDPDLHLYYYGTGNPTPAYTQGRGDGDNLFTGCLIALNVETGKMAWYFQASPHDTHDWDSTETPALADMPFNGRQRKLLMMATRNGYFYVLDRVTGEHLVTAKLGMVNNYASGIHPGDKPELDARGQVRRNPLKDASIPGALVNSDVLNFPPPTFSPDTGLFYVYEQNSLHIEYLMEPDVRGSMGLGGITTGATINFGTFLDAIDYRTGNVNWRHKLTGGSVGLLSTAGGVLFMSNGGGIEAIEAKTGRPLWHSDIGTLTAPPETFLLEGKQHVLAASGNGLFLFVMN